MRRRRRRSFSKERFLMIASSVLVLGLLTATGLWLGRDNSRQDDGYVVDCFAPFSVPYSPILLSQLPGNAFTPPDTCSFFQQPTGRDSDNTLLLLPGEGIVAAISKVGHWGVRLKSSQTPYPPSDVPSVHLYNDSLYVKNYRIIVVIYLFEKVMLNNILRD